MEGRLGSLHIRD